LSWLLIPSIVLMIIATAWSVVVWRAARDARLLLLTAMLVLMTARRMLTLVSEAREHGWRPDTAHTDAPEFVALIIAGLTLGAIVALHRYIRSRAGDQRALQMLGRALGDATEAVLITTARDGPTGPEGSIVYVNAAMCRLTGFPESELIGRTPDILQAPDDPRSDLKGLGHSLRAEAPSVTQAAGIRRDGARFSAMWSVSPVRDAGGTITHHLSILRDVSDHHQTESRLDLTLQMYERLLHGVSAIAWELDLSTWRFTFVSDAAERMLGYPVADWLKPDFWVNHVHPDDKDQAIAYCTGQTRAGSDHSLTYRMIAADGGAVWIEDIVTVIKRDGEAVGLRGVMVDVTQRRQSEAVVRRGNARYRALVEATDTGYVMLDDQGRVVEANDEFVRQTGRSSMAEVIGHYVTEWTAPEDVERNAAEVRRCIEFGDVRGLELTYLAPDGRRTPVEINATVHRENDGPGFIIGLCRDITERKRVEAEVRESRDRLDQIAESVEQAFWLMQPEPHRVLYVSPGFEHIWGRSASSLYENQMLWIESIHPDDRPSVLQQFERWRRDPVACPYEAEYRVVRPCAWPAWRSTSPTASAPSWPRRPARPATAHSTRTTR